MKKANFFVVLFCVVLAAGAIGCFSVSEYVTPMPRNVLAENYITGHGGDPNEYRTFLWANLADQLKLEGSVKAINEVTRQKLRHALELEDLTASQALGSLSSSIEAGRAKEDLLFGETGLVTMGLTLVGGSVLAGKFAYARGLMKKRPQDITPEELKKAVNGKDAVLTAKEHDIAEKAKQFGEVVKGIQDVLDDPEFTGADMLKNKLALRQSAETKKAIAVIKAA